MNAALVSPIDEYYFDLHGYSILHDCLGKEELSQINGWIDSLATPDFKKPGEWYDCGVEVQSYYANRPLEGVVDDGINLQHVFEVGLFEAMVDHPSWFPAVQHYLGEALLAPGRGEVIFTHSCSFYTENHRCTTPGGA
jgi:hypothetical protein